MLLLAATAPTASGNCPAWTLAGAGIGLGALSGNGEVPAVAQATVGTDIYQSPYVLAYFPAQVALRDVVPVDQFPDAVDLFFRQFVHPRGNDRIKVGLDQDLFCDLGTYAIDTAESYVGSLTVGNVYSSDTDHSGPPLMSPPEFLNIV